VGIDVAHYHGWHGRLHSPWWACLAIVRVALLQVFRRKLYWVVIGLGLLQFLFFWSVIYFLTQVDVPNAMRRDMHRMIGFSPDTPAGEENGYIRFMQQQSVVVMILLAFSGSLVVGSDFRMNSLPFYLSRRVDRRHYIVGKLLAVSAVVSILTTIPALLLFLEFGMFTSSVEYWVEHWDIAVSVLAYGLALCVVLSILLVTLSAYLQRVAPISITWASIFVMLRGLSAFLQAYHEDDRWHLLDLWFDIRQLGKLCFGRFQTDRESQLALWALLILSTVCCLALAALVVRVRAVEIVE
jgi:ABC-2 type transport system permease protein